jgi:WD40 repeat protein
MVSKKSLQNLVNIVLILMVLLSGCGYPPASPPAPTSLVAIPAPATLTAAPALPTAVPTPVQPTATPVTPTPTLVPAPVTNFSDPFSGELPAGAQTRLGNGRPFVLAYSPDGKTLAVGSPKGIGLYSADKLEQRLFLESDAAIADLAFSPDGLTLAVGTEKNTLSLWDPGTGDVLWTKTLEYEENGTVKYLAFSQDGSILASSSNNNFGGIEGSVILWDPANGEEIRTLDMEIFNYAPEIAFIPGGDTLAMLLSNGTLVFWETAAGEAPRTIPLGNNNRVGLVVSPTGGLLATGSWEGLLTFWNTTDMMLIKTIQLNGSIHPLAFSPDGSIFAFSLNKNGPGFPEDNVITLLDVASGNFLLTFDNSLESFKDAVFSPDGATLATGSWDNTIVLWDIANGEKLRSMTGQSDTVASIDISPDGNTLAVGRYGGSIDFYTITDNLPEVQTLTGQNGPVQSVDYSPDGLTLASASLDNSIILWNVAGAKKQRTLTGLTNGVLSVAFYSHRTHWSSVERSFFTGWERFGQRIG